MTESDPIPERSIDSDSQRTALDTEAVSLSSADLAAALRGHLAGVESTTRDLADALDAADVPAETLTAAVTDAEELTALLRELDPASEPLETTVVAEDEDDEDDEGDEDENGERTEADDRED
jgi:hypothetical protein